MHVDVRRVLDLGLIPLQTCLAPTIPPGTRHDVTLLINLASTGAVGANAKSDDPRK